MAWCRYRAALPGCSFRWGETTYMIGVVPLGGYVKMVGEGDGEEGDEDPRSFKNKPVWQRMAIISAGVTMNLILAFACFVFVFRTRGDDQVPGIIDRVDTGGPAWQVHRRARPERLGGSAPGAGSGAAGPPSCRMLQLGQARAAGARRRPPRRPCR